MEDSIIRKIDGTVCGKKTKTTTTTTVCVPGAGVEDVRKRVGKVMGPGKGMGSTLVHVGTNGADKVGTTELLELSTVGKGAE